MTVDPDVIRGLERAVLDAPENRALRLHLIRLLIDNGRAAAALDHCRVLADADGSDAEVTRLAAEARSRLDDGDPAAGFVPSGVPGPPDDPVAEPVGPSGPAGFAGVDDGDYTPTDLYDIVRPEVTLDDVAGMSEVKERIRLGFLEPLRNPDLTQAFGHSLRRSLLLWGPPGCGKTFLAKALAGELGVYFIPVGIADVLDMWFGQSERNVKALFAQARSLAPSVIFIDEVDALGRRRSQMRHDSTMRTVVNQLLSELDGVDSDNQSVFVLAATNQPWDVDPALVRPGRFDRMVLVLPPDREAREAILRYHLRNRPVGRLQLASIAERTELFSGADLAHLCERATELAFDDSVRTGTVRTIGQQDLERALADLRPSTVSWFRSAKNVARFSEDDRYDDLLRYLRRVRL